MKNEEFKPYRVTGVLYNSKKRFSLNYSSLIQATSINLWNGSIWLVDKNSGKKTLIRRVIN